MLSVGYVWVVEWSRLAVQHFPCCTSLSDDLVQGALCFPLRNINDRVFEGASRSIHYINIKTGLTLWSSYLVAMDMNVKGLHPY